MARLLSGSVSIPVSATLITGGVTAMLLNFPLWAIPLWAIAGLWFVAFICFQKQGVTIDVDECVVSETPEKNYEFIIKEFISSRHPDGLRKLELGMIPGFNLPVFKSIVFPTSINSIPKQFWVTYSMGSQVLDKAIKQQNIDWSFVLWLEATTLKGRWLTDGFLHPVQLVRNGYTPSVGESRVESSLNKKTQRRRGKGLGITEKQFEKILNKASQPIKKSEKEKS